MAKTISTNGFVPKPKLGKSKAVKKPNKHKSSKPYKGQGR